MGEEPHFAASSLAKAEDWLQSIADHIGKADRADIAWDQEAMVYLRSRGHDCHEPVTALVQSWKTAEQDWRDSWDGAPPGDYSTDATMLRTADCCGIPGFEAWWRRLASSRNEMLLQGGFETPTLAAYWLFNMLRSDYAIELMPQTLNRCLEYIALPGQNERPPWTCEDTERPDSMEQHLAHASALVFAHHRLSAGHPELAHEAVEIICRHEENGAWRTSLSHAEVSIESTAMAVHALALAQPRGWSRMAIEAREWLWSVQQADGSWDEPGATGPVHLTVLVLDAIALCDDTDHLTFHSTSAARKADRSPSESDVTAAPARIQDLNENSIRITASLTTGAEATMDCAPLATRQQRREAVDSYIREVLDHAGKKITRTDFWKKAGYKSRSEFERWERNDHRATKTAHQNFSRVLTEKPHLS